MDRKEFSIGFDIHFNSISSNQAPELNDYEKSVFLTKAQNQLVNEYFNIRTDNIGGGFDGSQKRQYDFSSIIDTKELTSISDSELESLAIKKMDKRSLVFKFPSDYFLSVNEILEDSQGQYSVLPISYSEYQTLMLKPYPYPVKRGAWRLFTAKINETVNEKTVDTTLAEIIGVFGDNLTYRLRYVHKLSPIILDDLTNYGNDIKIDGETSPTDCELPPETHQEILERAVTLAKIAWQGGTLTQVTAQSKNN